MEKLNQHISKIYGKHGEKWLSELPCKIKDLQEIWRLSSLKPLQNLSYNYVLEGFQNNIPVILKLSPDPEMLNQEAQALDAFKGFGAVSVRNHQEGALLLERALPGTTLKNFLPKSSRVEIVCKLIDRLHQAPLPSTDGFPTMQSWLEAIDKEGNLPIDLLDRARLWKKELLEKYSARQVLLHGDLHQENILSSETGWVVIDPKGVLGDPIHEIWACVEDPVHDLHFLAAYFHYPFEDVVKWYYVHLILAACWQVEDRLDPSSFLALAHSVLPIITP